MLLTTFVAMPTFTPLVIKICMQAYNSNYILTIDPLKLISKKYFLLHLLIKVLPFVQV